MIRFFSILAFAALYSQFSIAAPTAGFSRADLDAQLRVFLEWHQGTYDNYAQLVRQSGGPLAKPVIDPVYRLRTIYLPIEMPEFGEHVLYVEEYKNNDVNDNARVRLYVLTIDEKEQAIKIKIWMPLDPKPLVGSFKDLSRAKQLKKTDMRPFRDVCDVWMRWTGSGFEGGMKDRSCDREDWWYDYDVAVGPEHQWQRDRGRKLSNSNEIAWSLAAEQSEVWFEQWKARNYLCEVEVAGGVGRMQRVSTVELLDQGGDTEVVLPSGKRIHLLLFRSSPTVPSLSASLNLVVRDRTPGVSPLVVEGGAVGTRIGLANDQYTVTCRQP